MNLRKLVKEILRELGLWFRTIKDVDSWDGSAARWDTAEAYCSDCLIDVNSSGEEKSKSLCKLPIREPGDPKTTYVRQAAHAAAGAMAGARQPMQKPDGVSDEDWESAMTSAANKLIEIYDEMEEVAPDSIYEIAGKTPPETNERAIAMNDAWWAAMQQAWEVDDWANVIDIYTDDGVSLYAVIASGAKLYRAPVTVIDDQIVLSKDWTEVVHKQQFDPIEQSRGTFLIRQTDEGYRWFSVSCSAILNRSGAIDSRDLFDSFIAHAEESGEYPIRQFYHQGEQFKTGQCDYLARDNWLLITSGLYDDTELARAEIEARQNEPDYWGESIGFYADDPEMFEVQDGIKIPVYNTGILSEISTLPESDAAAWLTNNTYLQEVTRMLSQKAMDALVKLMGDEDKAQQWLEDNVDPANRSIDESDVLRRAHESVDVVDEVDEVETDETETPEAEVAEVETDEVETDEVEDETDDEDETPESVEPDVSEVEIDETIIQQITEQFTESETVTQLRTQIESMTQTIERLVSAFETFEQEQIARNVRVVNRLKALEEDEESKKAKYLQDVPRVNKTVVTYRPRDNNSEQDIEPEMQEVAASTLNLFPEK